MMPFYSPATQAPILSAVILAAVLTVSTPAARAQQAPPTPSTGSTPAPARGATTVLVRVLDNLGKESGLSVLADSTVASEHIPVPTPQAMTVPPLPESEVEKPLNRLVRTLPQGTVCIKLQLPTPASGRTWKGDDVAAFAFAQARLFGTVGVPSTDGSIEVLGKRVTKEATPTYVTGLSLKPDYLVTNTRRKDSTTPWSPNIEKQWSPMSPEERKQFGQEQVTLFLSLPQEPQAQMIRDLKQHDKFFDAVKGPMEKVIGHNL